MCVFTDRNKKALAFALVPIVAINIYAGCKMLTKTSKDTEVKSSTSIEEVIDVNTIQGDTYLELDESVVSTQVDITEISQDSNGNIVIEDLKQESDLSKLERIYSESGNNVDSILVNEDKNSDLYSAALYTKLKNSNIPEDIIRNELNNIIVYGSNATCMSDEEWECLFGNLGRTISIYDNVVDYYYPLAKYVHLYSCDLEHEALFFDDFRISCNNIKELYNVWNPQIDLKDYFTEMVTSSCDIKLIDQFNGLVSSNIDFEILLNELENVYVFSMIPIGLSDEEWLMLFGNLEKTVPVQENVCMYYYDLSFYLHNLWCDFEHHLNQYDRYTCDAYSLTLEKPEF